MQQWTCGPAVLPHLTDDAIQHHLRVVGSHHLGIFQAVTAHLTGEAKWLAEGAEAVKVKLASVLMEYRDSGRAAIPPDASPIFKDLCEHSAKPMLEDGFKGTSKELTHLQLEYIMDEMRGFPDVLADTDLPADKLAKFHVAICGAGVMESRWPCGARGPAFPTPSWSVTLISVEHGIKTSIQGCVVIPLRSLIRSLRIQTPIGSTTLPMVTR